MIPYSQIDARWKNKQLGSSGGLSIGSAGCFLTSLSMLAGMEPDVTNTTLVSQDGYIGGNMINSQACANILGLAYNGEETTNPGTICIFETNAHAPVYPTHFGVIFPDGTIIDPLDINPQRKPNTYSEASLISFRLFSPLIPYLMSEQDPPIPDWAVPTVQKMHNAGITTDPNTTNLPIYQVLAIVDKYLS